MKNLIFKTVCLFTALGAGIAEANITPVLHCVPKDPSRFAFTLGNTTDGGVGLSIFALEPTTAGWALAGSVENLPSGIWQDAGSAITVYQFQSAGEIVNVQTEATFAAVNIKLQARFAKVPTVDTGGLTYDYECH